MKQENRQTYDIWANMCQMDNANQEITRQIGPESPQANQETNREVQPSLEPTALFCASMIERAVGVGYGRLADRQ